jgi:hypothetical protein
MKARMLKFSSKWEAIAEPSPALLRCAYKRKECYLWEAMDTPGCDDLEQRAVIPKTMRAVGMSARVIVQAKVSVNW